MNKRTLNITFDKSAANFIIDIFKKDFPLKCCACGKKITAKNLGGVIYNKGFIHENIVCLILNEQRKEMK